MNAQKAMELANLKEVAKNFLKVADMLDEKVSRYFNFSNNTEDVDAYYEVKRLSNNFADCYNKYIGENDLSHEGLHYEVAESILAN